MEKCNCWEEKYQIVGWYDAQTPMLSKKPIQCCNGTKEREKCTCDGDKSKCDFYSEKRKENKMTTLEMMNEAIKDGKTYKTYDLRYNATIGFHDKKGHKWEANSFKYINDIFAIDTWQLKPENEMTKSEAEAKFNIKIVGD